MSTTSRALAAAEATIKDSSVTQLSAASAYKVSATSVNRARRILLHGISTLVTKVRGGEMTLNQAEQITYLSAGDQAHYLSLSNQEANSFLQSLQPGKPSAFTSSRSSTSPLRHHMTLAELGMVKPVAEMWEERREEIKGLDRDDLAVFLKEMRKSRAAVSRLIKIIEQEIKE